jgi:hypothetical protein
MGISSFVMVMSISLFVCGVVSMGIGGDLKVIAEQTKKLGEKGISEDVAGLVGNASSLIDALNQLVKTTSGIGVFLIMIGFLLMLSAYYILLRLA